MLWEDNVIPPHLWKELNAKYTIDVFMDNTGCTVYRVMNKITNTAEIETYVKEEVFQFYRKQAIEIEIDFERIVLGE